MQDSELYGRILGISDPWRVERVELQLQQGEVHFYLADDDKREWPCPECGVGCALYDHQAERQWRHLDTCQYRTILHAAPPRSECREHGVRVVKLPWAEANSRFTALMEGLALAWLKQASQKAGAEQLHLSWDEIHGIMERAVERGLARRKAEEIAYLGVDEKAFRKGHKYLTLVNDLSRYQRPMRRLVRHIAMNSVHSVPLSTDRRIQSYLRASLSAGRETARIGSFLASSDSTSANIYRNYAVPNDGANPEPSEISALVGWYEQRSRVARLEYLPSAAPKVELVLVLSGFSAEGRLPVMICKMETGKQFRRPEAIEILTAQDDVTLRAAAHAQNEAYGEANTTEADVARLRRTVQSGGMVLLARDLHTGEPAGAGLYSAPLGGVTEIAAIGVRPRFRRRGIAGALTSQLNQAAIESGIQIPFLMAAHPAEQRLYARAGFVTCSEILHISKERPG